MGIFDFFKGKSKAAPAPAGATDTSAAPADALIKELQAHGFDVSTVDIEVDGGKVTLNGAVNSRAEMEKIVLAVGNTKGVAQVENNLIAPDADPEAPSGVYIVKEGDTLWKIAEASYGDGKRYEEIFEANKPMLKHPDKIYPGQRLRIPGGTGPAVADAAIWAPPAEIAKKA
ncbi:peptidoglycan-binding protein LysM [Methylocystis parvus]|uniref:Peptidoglycan-binding protein LysM n=1 Tax=Methylocystis parvus TaxID=134 RepID=A0A6B8M923_9HYPH|nr:peptidoglycan-binding protein LysM [Methylocystis parvus]QGM98905.1 peptidoglycan-binding protein LysM [Methylocystis parvus]WBK00739.1 peptidoglycan-binding protein LysM [Methylocystis parvus OBBP]